METAFCEYAAVGRENLSIRTWSAMSDLPEQVLMFSFGAIYRRREESHAQGGLYVRTMFTAMQGSVRSQHSRCPRAH